MTATATAAAPERAGARPGTPLAERRRCSFCGTQLDPSTVALAPVPSNVRRFAHETFHLWRCPGCACVHCLEVVDLARYYEGYPIPRQLSAGIRHGLDNLLSRLTAHGFARGAALLDYGCGWGLFLEHLREQGYTGAVGFDPYSAIEAYRDRSRLKPGAFDFVVLQDVLEHVEDPRVLFATADECLRPGGHVLVGTPNAGEIALSPYQRFWSDLHPPYNLHLYTRAALEALGREAGWEPVGYYRRSYYDTRRPGLNMHAIVKYQWFTDGTLDGSAFTVPPERLRRSPRYMFYARFGYWWPRKGNMTVVFRKTGRDWRGRMRQRP